MKRKTNFIELLVWAACVSFVISQPAHSQSVPNDSLFGDSTWSGSFDMGSMNSPSSGGEIDGLASSGAQGDQAHQTIKQQKPAELPRSPKASLEQANNGNIALGSYGGTTKFPSGSYSFGFNGTGASTSPFNTGLPTTSTGSVDLSITD